MHVELESCRYKGAPRRSPHFYDLLIKPGDLESVEPKLNLNTGLSPLSRRASRHARARHHCFDRELARNRFFIQCLKCIDEQVRVSRPCLVNDILYNS